ncbi:copper transporter [Bacillota bacterium LX-D]|nr:copper transporter [Bacillota bacterium LX-D]
MVDFRFHITTLVAIFLALGVGIFIGSTIVGDDALLNEQKAITDRLEQDFILLREQNRLSQKEILAFKNSNDNYQQFANAVLPLLVKNKLLGLNIAFIVTNNNVATDSLKKSFELSGANLVSITRIDSSFNFTDQNMKTFLINKLDLSKVRTSADFAAKISLKVAEGVLNGFDPLILKTLEEVNYATTELFKNVKPDIAIIFGGSQGPKENTVSVIDLPMINYFLKQGLEVVGTEPSQVTFSYMGLYQSKKIITVDNVDSAIGQIALILAINGSPGNYGIKTTADRLLPLLDYEVHCVN